MNKNTKLKNKNEEVILDESAFKNDKERIRKISSKYANKSIKYAFNNYYNLGLEDDDKFDTNIGTDVIELEIGGHYVGIVKEINKHHILFDIPGIKDEIICYESFGGSITNIQNYLLTHDNTLMFEVRSYERGSYIVSIMSAMYALWKSQMNTSIIRRIPIQVHIDSLTKGGYLCSTVINTLYELTGKLYTHSVFIPGSSIVLNIETDFEQWVGKDVMVIPQKFMEFRKNVYEGYVENSLICSRKYLLQLRGNQNLYEIYNRFQLTNNKNFVGTPETFSGHVTGIINSGTKTGVFVELDDKYITGLMPVDSLDLINYKPGSPVNVTVDSFEIKPDSQPFVFNQRGDMIKCNTRVIFKEVV